MTDDMSPERQPENDHSELRGEQFTPSFRLAPEGGPSLTTSDSDLINGTVQLDARTGEGITRQPGYRPGTSPAPESQPSSGGIKKLLTATGVAVGGIAATAAIMFGADKLRSNDQDPETGGGSPGVTETINPQPTPSPVETVTPTETPATPEVEVPFPYELAYQKEYKLADTTLVLGIEKAVYDRPEGNRCKEDLNSASAQNWACPPIKEISLTDEYIRKYGSDKFPDGMSEQELEQRLNDGIIKMHLENLHQLGTYKDMTVEDLKKAIHEGKAPTYSITFPNGDGVTVDPSKPIYIVDMDTPGVNYRFTSGLSYDYKNFKGGLVMGMWSGTSHFLIDENPGPTQRVGFYYGGDVLTGLLGHSIPTAGSTEDLNTRYVPELRKRIASASSEITPVHSGVNIAGIFSLK